jgi:muramoyltetrapeptide carboxypeptidase
MTSSKISLKSAVAVGEAPMSIYCFSPAGAVRTPDRFHAGVTRLQTQGYRVQVDRNALTTFQRFAGTDKQRVAAFERAAASKNDIALITRGGYGITRLLPDLNFQALASSGKRWVGFSDFTAFQLGMLAKGKATTYSGPALMEDFGTLPHEVDLDADVREDKELTHAMFAEAMRDDHELLGFATKAPASYKGFEASGVLWGGNLSVLCALQGSEYFPKVRGGLLMLEDVAEPPYRVERMLTQLHHSGVLDAQKAVLLGNFNQYKLSPHDDGFDIPAVVKWLRSKTKTPIITGLPIGHAPLKFTLPHGAKIGVAIEGGTCYLLMH